MPDIAELEKQIAAAKAQVDAALAHLAELRSQRQKAGPAMDPRDVRLDNDSAGRWLVARFQNADAAKVVARIAYFEGSLQKGQIPMTQPALQALCAEAVRRGLWER